MVVVASPERGEVLVRTRTQAGCARCERGEGCGGGIFGKLIRTEAPELRLADPGLSLAAGDWVILGVDEALFLHASLTTYARPLLGLFAGSACGFWLSSGQDWAAAVGGVLGFLALIGLQTRAAAPHPVILRRATALERRACMSVT